MSTTAEYLCYACNITMKLRGYEMQESISCPQCNAEMPMTNASARYDYDSGYLGETRHRFFRHRTYTPLFPTHALIKPMLTDDEIKALIQKSITARLDVIDKTATNARLTSESLRQSVVDQQSMVNQAKRGVKQVEDDVRALKRQRDSDTRSLSGQTMKIDELSRASSVADEKLRVIDTRSIETADALESTANRLNHTRETVKKLAMGYVDETPAAKPTTKATASTAAAATTPAIPGIADVAKTVGGAMLEGVTLGLTTQFVGEATGLLIKKSLAAGLITPALAESDMFREALKLVVPMILLAASQYPMMPKKEFVGKAASIALRGQTAAHSATVMAFGMSLVGDMLALPSASKLEDQLSAAQ